MTHHNTPLLPFNKITPQLDSPVFVFPSAFIIGDVTVGKHTSIWFNTTVRGDMHWIKIGSETNIQDNSVVHVTNDSAPTTIGNRVTIGHQCIIHGCTIEDECLIGMGSIILDNARIGKGAFIGAGSLVTQNTVIDPHTLAFGRPAKSIRKLSVEEHQKIISSAAYYTKTAQAYPYEF